MGWDTCRNSGSRGWVQKRTKAVISLKCGKKGPRLLLRTNKKSHTRFQLEPKSMTLDGLKESLCILFSKHIRHGVVSPCIVSHSSCFQAVNDCNGHFQPRVSKAGVIPPTCLDFSEPEAKNNRIVVGFFGWRGKLHRAVSLRHHRSCFIGFYSALRSCLYTRSTTVWFWWHGQYLCKTNKTGICCRRFILNLHSVTCPGEQRRNNTISSETMLHTYV